MRGLLVTFEGIDFSGKSLQAGLLRTRLTKEHRPAILLREPGGTEISEKIRRILLDKENYHMTAQAELLLYSAARSQMVSEQIIPNLEQGKIVICDRYYDSTTAYQGYGREIDLDFVTKLNKFVTHAVKPDLTFLLDLDPEVAQTRSEAGSGQFDRLEQENLDFHRRVRQGYLELAAAESDRFVVLDASLSPETIQQEIYERFKTKMATLL